ncbi:MAG: LapA family protein [Deltaproteobacteria bacterium]|nr:LapA family protein [bacterium]MCB9489121.1 LapA family protein [Deltaproteobacteria bacterium]
MRAVKFLLLLIFAVVLGFILHNNWNWLSKTEPVVVFVYEYAGHPPSADEIPEAAGEEQPMEYRLQTYPLPYWSYLLMTMFIGAAFVAFGAFRDVMKSRRLRKQAQRELADLKERYAGLRGAEDQDLAYNVGDKGLDDLRDA